jgi:hypothetical protein
MTARWDGVESERSPWYDLRKGGKAMVTLFAAGNKIGTLADAPKLIEEFINRNYPIEFRNEAGELVGNFVPVQTPTSVDPGVPWEPDLTREEIERRVAEPGLTYDEVKKRLGWE